MNSSVNNLVKVLGISENFPKHAENFKQFNLQTILSIHKSNPEIKELLKVSVKPTILNSKLSAGTKGISQNGQRLTSRELIVNGILIQDIEYTGNSNSSTMQTCQFKTPFSNFIILESNPYCSKLKIIPYIEDLYIKQISDRTIFINVMMILNCT